MLRKLLFLLITVFAAPVIWAQVTVVASVDKTVAEVGEEITLIIAVTGAASDLGVPDLPSLPNFNYFYTGFGSSSVNINGKYIATNRYSYTLVPRFAGKAEIAPIEVSHLGKKYSSAPITIDVYRKGESGGKTPPQQPAQPKPAATPAQKTTSATTSAPQLGKRPALPANASYSPPRPKDGYPEVFFNAVTDKKTAYVGEQINLTLAFYTARELQGSIFYTPPAFEGVIKEDTGSSNGIQVLDNKDYGYNLINTALFGALPGKAEIGKARIDYVYLRSRGVSALDLFFGTNAVSESVQTSPITLTIKPLPEEGKGEHFYGAVGKNFYFTAEADRTVVEAGEAVNLVLTLKGFGNLKSITSPKLPSLPGFKIYEVAGASNTTVINGEIQGVKTFKYVLVPAASGIYNLPEVPFTFFNPNTEKYQTVVTKEISIDVKPMSGAYSAEAVSYGGAEGAGEGLRVISNEINYIKTGAQNYKETILTRLAALKWINIIPLFIIALIILFKAAAKYGWLDRPYTKAKKELKAAAGFNDLNGVLARYIKAKTSLSTGMLTTKALAAQLGAKYGVCDKTQKRLISLQEGLDLYKYAPLASVDGQTLHRAKAQVLLVIKTLEKELK